MSWLAKVRTDLITEYQALGRPADAARIPRRAGRFHPHPGRARVTMRGLATEARTGW